MKTRLLVSLSIFAGLIVVAVSMMGLIMWQFNRPPFELSRLTMLQPDMRTNEVEQVLGSPTRVIIGTNTGTQMTTKWVYQRLGGGQIVYLHFHRDGTFDRHEYDH